MNTLRTSVTLGSIALLLGAMGCTPPQDDAHQTRQEPLASAYYFSEDETIQLDADTNWFWDSSVLLAGCDAPSGVGFELPPLCLNPGVYPFTAENAEGSHQVRVHVLNVPPSVVRFEIVSRECMFMDGVGDCDAIASREDDFVGIVFGFALTSEDPGRGRHTYTWDFGTGDTAHVVAEAERGERSAAVSYTYPAAHDGGEGFDPVDGTWDGEPVELTVTVSDPYGSTLFGMVVPLTESAISLEADSDSDGLPDTWELSFGLDPSTADADEDPDGDGLTNAAEYAGDTHPRRSNAPGEPSILFPGDGDLVASVPLDFVWRAALDPDFDEVTYTLEVVEDVAGFPVAYTVDDVTGAGATVSHRIASPTDVLPDADFLWRVRGRDAHGEGPWTPYAAFSIDLLNEAPTAPVAVSPFSVISTLAPAFTVLNATDPNDRVDGYLFQVGTDGSFSELVAESDAVDEGPAETSWTPPSPLPRRDGYAWRARAFDSAGALGPWSETLEFTLATTNQPPPAPEILAPLAGATVETFPVLVVLAEVEDPDGDPLRARVAYGLVGDETQQVVVADVPEEGHAQLFLEPTVPGEYAFRVSLSDGAAEGPAASASFTLDPPNVPPGAAIPLSPRDDALVDTLTPTLVARPGPDPDDAVILHDIEIYEADVLTMEILGVETEPGEFVSYTLPEPLLNRTPYAWRIRGRDDAFATSTWSELATFQTAAGNLPPLSPSPISPVATCVPSSAPVPLLFQNATDPDGDPLSYRVDVYEGDTVVASVDGVLPGQGTTQVTLVEGLPDGRYTWSVVAFDGAEESPPSDVASFCVGDDTAEDTGCGCNSTPTRGGGLFAVLTLGWLWRRKRHAPMAAAALSAVLVVPSAQAQSVVSPPSWLPPTTVASRDAIEGHQLYSPRLAVNGHGEVLGSTIVATDLVSPGVLYALQLRREMLASFSFGSADGGILQGAEPVVTEADPRVNYLFSNPREGDESYAMVVATRPVAGEALDDDTYLRFFMFDAAGRRVGDANGEPMVLYADGEARAIDPSTVAAAGAFSDDALMLAMAPSVGTAEASRELWTRSARGGEVPGETCIEVDGCTEVPDGLFTMPGAGIVASPFADGTWVVAAYGANTGDGAVHLYRIVDTRFGTTASPMPVIGVDGVYSWTGEGRVANSGVVALDWDDDNETLWIAAVGPSGRAVEVVRVGPTGLVAERQLYGGLDAQELHGLSFMHQGSELWLTAYDADGNPRLFALGDPTDVSETRVVYDSGVEGVDGSRFINHATLGPLAIAPLTDGMLQALTTEARDARTAITAPAQERLAMGGGVDRLGIAVASVREDQRFLNVRQAKVSERGLALDPLTEPSIALRDILDFDASGPLAAFTTAVESRLVAPYDGADCELGLPTSYRSLAVTARYGVFRSSTQILAVQRTDTPCDQPLTAWDSTLWARGDAGDVLRAFDVDDELWIAEGCTAGVCVHGWNMDATPVERVSEEITGVTDPWDAAGHGGNGSLEGAVLVLYNSGTGFRATRVRSSGTTDLEVSWTDMSGVPIDVSDVDELALTAIDGRYFAVLRLESTIRVFELRDDSDFFTAREVAAVSVAGEDPHELAAVALDGVLAVGYVSTLGEQVGARFIEIPSVSVNGSVVLNRPSGAATSVLEGELIGFSVSPSNLGTCDPDSYLYHWSFGDGQDLDGRGVGHVYHEPGTYTVVARARNEDPACDARWEGEVTVLNGAPVVTGFRVVGAPRVDATVRLEVDAVDPGPGALRVDWYLGEATSSAVQGIVTGDAGTTRTFAAAISLNGVPTGALPVRVVISDGTVETGYATSIFVREAVTPVVADVDGDGMDDDWERARGFDPSDASDADADADGDGATNAEEFRDGTDPRTSDAPAAPVPLSPRDGAMVDGLVELQVANVADRGRGDLDYLFRVYRGRTLSRLVYETTVGEGPVSTRATINSALLEDTEYCWRAQVSDALATGPFGPTVCFVYNAINAAPSTPEPVSPFSFSLSNTPDFVVAVAPDADGDEQLLQIEVAADADDPSAFVTGQLGIGTRAGLVTWTPETTFTADFDAYAWRARLVDEIGAASEWSAWSRYELKDENQAPGPVAIQLPVDGSVLIATQVLFTVTGGEDPDGDPTQLVVTAWPSDPTEPPAAFSRPRTDDEVQDIGVPFAREGHYTVEIYASDGVEQGEPASVDVFVRPENHVPVVPTLVSPEDGGSVLTRRPALVVGELFDADGDDVLVDIEIREDTEEALLVAQVFGLQASAGSVTAEAPVGLENGSTYRWRARALDDFGGVSAWSVHGTFVVDAENDPPTAPVPIAPVAATLPAGGAIVLEAQNATDPDGDTLVYLFEVARDADMTDVIDASEPVRQGQSLTRYDVRGELPEGRYYWRVTAHDGAGPGPTSDTATFDVVLAGGSDDTGCACTQSRAPAHNWLLGGWIMVGLLWRRRRTGAGIALALSLVFAAGTAQAQDEPSTEDRAYDIADEAGEAFDNGDFDRAIELLDQAYALHPMPDFLFNRAVVLEEAGRFEEALEFLRANSAQILTVIEPNDYRDFENDLAERVEILQSAQAAGEETEAPEPVEPDHTVSWILYGGAATVVLTDFLLVDRPFDSDGGACDPDDVFAGQCPVAISLYIVGAAMAGTAYALRRSETRRAEAANNNVAFTPMWVPGGAGVGVYMRW